MNSIKPRVVKKQAYETKCKTLHYLILIIVSGYDNIRRLLMSPNDDDDECAQHADLTIQHFTKDLAEGIKGDGITMLSTALHSKRILNSVDRDQILSELINKTDYHAVLMLLDRMKSRTPPRIWYCEFLQALVDIQCKHLVEMMEPKFISNNEAFMKTFGMHLHPYKEIRFVYVLGKHFS